MTTESTEMYLLTVYRLTERAEYTTVRDIAAALSFSMSSVSEKVKRMADSGYLEHEWGEGVSLSESGKRISLKMLRKRRLIETFLVSMADYSFDEVHNEACRLEHIVSDRFADSLDKILGFPRRDPHGHPIPNKEGVITYVGSNPLTTIPIGESVTIVEFYQMDNGRLRYLAELGLKPQVNCKVLQAAPFDGPLTIEAEQQTITIARSLASYIGVEQIEKEIKSEPTQ